MSTGDPVATGSRRRAGAWSAIGALGLVTITAYGAWFYAFGVLVGDIETETGWGLGGLGGCFAASQLVAAAGSTVAGRALDRFGARPVLAVQAVVAAPLLVVASRADHFATFAVAGALGGGVLGAVGFYHVTTAVATRVGPGAPHRSIGVLTMIGAFCSPIYLPVTAHLVESVGWRPTLRVLAAAVGAGAIVAMALVNGGAAPERPAVRRSLVSAVAGALPDRRVQAMLVAAFVSWLAYGAVLVYQVPILEEAGLTVTTAATIGGLRGFCQLFGRIGIVAIVARHGGTRSLAAAYLLSAVGILALLASGRLPAAVGFAVLVGMAVGAVSPLQAIVGHELFDPDDLGTLLGVQQTVAGLAGAAGPFTAGMLAERAGTLVPTVWLGAAAMLVAVASLATGSRGHWTATSS